MRGLTALTGGTWGPPSSPEALGLYMLSGALSMVSLPILPQLCPI